MADSLYGLGVDIIFRPGYEMGPRGAHQFTATGADYLTFVRYLRHRFAARKTLKAYRPTIYFDFAPEGHHYRASNFATKVAPFYADDAFELIGGDFYQRNTTAATFQMPATTGGMGLAEALTFATTNSRGARPATTPGVTDGTKRFWTGEMGCCEATDDAEKKGAWFDALLALFKSTPSWWGVVYNDTLGSTGVADLHIDTTAISLSHWVGFVNDPIFATGP
jgi:hypothetical protein